MKVDEVTVSTLIDDKSSAPGSGRPQGESDDDLTEAHASRRTARLRAAGWAALPPLTFVAILVGWGLAVRVFDIPPYLLPGPVEVFERLVQERESIFRNALTT